MWRKIALLAVITTIGSVGLVSPGRSRAAVPEVSCQAVEASSALPSASEVISPANAPQLRQVALVGRGSAYNGTLWSPDGQILAVQSNIGVWLYSTLHWEQPPRLLPH